MRDVAKPDLDVLALGKPNTEGLALTNVFLRNLHGGLGEPKPAHAVREPRRPEPYLRHPQAVADIEQDVLFRNLQPVIFDLAVTAVLVRPHDRDAAHDVPTGLVLVIEEGSEALARIVRGARDQDEMRGALSTGDEPFEAADDVAVALLFRA